MNPIPRLASALLLAACASHVESHPREPDPAATDGDKYKVVLENDQVRVLRYRDEPGTKTHPHHHPDFVMVALTPFRRQLTFSDGTKREREFQGGEVAWMPAQSHTGENIGTTPTEALLIEVKRR